VKRKRQQSGYIFKARGIGMSAILKIEWWMASCAMTA
jgi:hypothetical protein